jgi:peroxiredoxin
MGKNRRWIQIAILTVAVVIGGFTVGTSLFQDKGGIPQAGDALPAFSLYGIDGELYRAEDYKGQVMMVNFWGSFCPPCINEMPAIQSQYERWKDQGLIVLGVNLDEATITIKSFVKQTGVTFPILLDPKLRITKQFGVKQYPTTFFVDRNGNIEEVKIGEMTENYIQRKIMSLLER